MKPQLFTRKDQSNTTNTTFDRAAHQKKVKEWCLSPLKYCKEIAAEQAKYAGKCLFHLTKSHQTCDCYILKDGDKDGSSTKKQTNSSGQLRHITEEEPEVEMIDENLDDNSADLGNDTNADSLHYFARVTNHYLHLVKSSSSLNVRHSMDFPIIADSGANQHMFKDLQFFESLQPTTGNVILGDGVTSLDIKGIGTVKLLIDGHTLLVDNVRYIPELSESIYSLFVHVQSPNHGLRSSFETGLHILFPNFTTTAILGEHDIYLNALPGNQQIKCTSFLSIDSSQAVQGEDASVCCHATIDTVQKASETVKGDNILTTLRQYYKNVQTKRQLNFEVPAGFRRENMLQRQIRDVTNSNSVLPMDHVEPFDDL